MVASQATQVPSAEREKIEKVVENRIVESPPEFDAIAAEGGREIKMPFGKGPGH